MGPVWLVDVGAADQSPQGHEQFVELLTLELHPLDGEPLETIVGRHVTRWEHANVEPARGAPK